MFLLACLYEYEKNVEQKFVCPPKIKVSPKILTKGTNCPPMIKS